DKIGRERIIVSASCSLLHSPCDLELETNEHILTPEVKQWLAFAKQKIDEIVTLSKLAEGSKDESLKRKLEDNQAAMESRKTSDINHDKPVKKETKEDQNADFKRKSPFSIRKEKQKELLNHPLFPTTTIGSFPQTSEIRKQRALFKKGSIDIEKYEQALKLETEKTIRWQEEIDLDVLVHGEFE